MSSYRPNYEGPPPPPPPLHMPSLPPLPPGPPPSYDSRGDSRVRNYGQPFYSLPQSDFSFRVQDPAPQYPRERENHRNGSGQNQNYNHRNRPSHHISQQNRSSHTNGHQDRSNYNDGRLPNGNSFRNSRDTRRGGRPFRGRGPKVMPSDRPLLQQRGGGDSEEHLLGVDSDTQKYIPVDDISNSEEEDMDESDSDQGHDDDKKDQKHNSDSEPPAKRQAVSADRATNSDSIPKWSNPDPYSVLPPVDEIQRKRKDPVAYIRKAFKATEAKSIAQNQVAANDDFISFDDEIAESTAPSSRAGSESRWTLENVVLDMGDQFNAMQLAIEADPFLGSRKRTHDDEIKPNGQSLKASPAHPTGSLLQDWIPLTLTEATPWLDKETCGIMSPAFRLHREICDFFHFVRPQHHEQAIRQALLSRLQALISRELTDCTVLCFGSFAAGLYLPNADMDIVINSDTFRNTGQGVICQTKNKLHKFGQFIRGSHIAKEGSVEVIAGAKVPLIRFVDRVTAIKVDVSFENDTGLAANETFTVWKQQYPALPILVAIIKQFLMMRGLNEVQFGGLGGFSVTCLVVSLLQNMPRVQDGSFIPEQNLGEVLIEFLDFYGNRIDISRTGLMMNPPGYFDKQAADRLRLRGPVYNPNRSERIAIIDPNRPGNDISGGSKNVGLIFDRFSRAHAELLTAMRAYNRPSLLDWLLGGNYESFAWHRARLRDIGDEKPPTTSAPNNRATSSRERPISDHRPKITLREKKRAKR